MNDDRGRETRRERPTDLVPEHFLAALETIEDEGVRRAAYRVVLELARPAAVAAAPAPPGAVDKVAPVVAEMAPTRRHIDIFRTVYSGLVLVQLVTLALYETALTTKEVAVPPGLMTSLAGPVLSFLVARHNYRHRRATSIDVASAAASYLVTCLSFAILYLVIADHDAAAFGRAWAGSRLAQLGTAVYFSIVTITTTGYGDLVPGSALARTVVVWEILTGLLYQVFIFSLVASTIVPAPTAAADRSS